MVESAPPKTRESVEVELAVKAWQDPTLLEALRADPKAVIAKEYGVQIPDQVQVELIEESPNKLYLRLPPNPNDMELSDEQLEAVAGGECVVTATVWTGVIASITASVGAASATVAASISSVTVAAQVSVDKGW